MKEFRNFSKLNMCKIKPYKKQNQLTSSNLISSVKRFNFPVWNLSFSINFSYSATFAATRAAAVVRAAALPAAVAPRRVRGRPAAGLRHLGCKLRMRVEFKFRTYLICRTYTVPGTFELTAQWNIEEVKIAALNFWENPEKNWSKFSKIQQNNLNYYSGNFCKSVF